MSSNIPQSPLANPTALPLRPVTELAQFGSTLVVAPHPDDESLGCGGAIALLRRLGCPVQVLVISDGTRSHPNSRAFPSAALQTLREEETLSALAILGVEPQVVTFLRLKDGAVPNAVAVGFDQAIALAKDYLAATTVPLETIILPWRRDPHPDHRAAWEIIHTALADMQQLPRLVEYPIWDWDSTQRVDTPAFGMTAWRLDVSAVLPLKQLAIAAHRSQTTNLIDDDPECFRLTPEMLAHFAHPWELYYEASL